MLRYIKLLAILLCMVAALVLPSVARSTFVNEASILSPNNMLETPVSTNGVEGNQIEVCSEALNIAIPDNNTAGINHTIQVPNSSIIVDANILLSITHTHVGNLFIRVTKAGDAALLIDRPESGTCNGNDINENVSDDEAVNSFETDCDSGGVAAYTPGASYYSGEAKDNPLEIFDLTDSEGTWILNVQDHQQSETGTLRRWCVQLTLEEPKATPTNTPVLTATPTTVSPTPTPTIPGTVTPTPIVDLALNYLPLITQKYQPSPCISIEREPNNNSTDADLNLPLCQSTIMSGTMPQTDPGDYYRIVISNQSAIRINLFNIAQGSDFDLYLYDSALNLLDSSSNNGSSDESITRNLPQGTYFVRVYPDPTEPGGQRTYQLMWNRS